MLGAARGCTLRQRRRSAALVLRAMRGRCYAGALVPCATRGCTLPQWRVGALRGVSTTLRGCIGALRALRLRKRPRPRSPRPGPASLAPPPLRLRARPPCSARAAPASGRGLRAADAPGARADRGAARGASEGGRCRSSAWVPGAVCRRYGAGALVPCAARGCIWPQWGADALRDASATGRRGARPHLALPVLPEAAAPLWALTFRHPGAG